jgi:hypothetical protein
MRWAGDITYKREKRNACKILVENPEGIRPLGPRSRQTLELQKMLEISRLASEEELCFTQSVIMIQSN